MVVANARWVQNGVTVAGGNGEGRGVNQLYNPHGLCVDEEDNVIVADCGNDRIMEWKHGATSGTVLAGGNGPGKRPDQLAYPTDVILEVETDSLIICEGVRVTRWPRRSGTREGETIINNIDCYGLTMDDEGSLYVTGYKKYEVRRYRRGETNGTVVAGGNGEGVDLHQLDQPLYVCLDREQTVYVSDNENHRVMKWVKGAKEGISLAGGRKLGKDLMHLHYPKGVQADATGNVYVADSANHRVMRWRPGATQGTVVVGGNGEGKGANQFKCPTGLSFDQHGHLYVADCSNHRVQRFSLENNWIKNIFLSSLSW